MSELSFILLHPLVLRMGLVSTSYFYLWFTSFNLHYSTSNIIIKVVAVEVVVAKVALIIPPTEGPSIVPGT